MTLQWTDIGVNLTNQRFDQDRDQVIEQSIVSGVTRLIVTGTNLKESQAAFQLCQNRPDVIYATAGCHPHDAKSLTPDDLNDLKRLAIQPNVVAIGECGLDFNRNFSPPKTQLAVFEQQLKLAAEIKKPLFLHERDAFEAQFNLLQQYQNDISGGVAHCFTGTKEQLQAYLSLDLYIGITGWICDERRGTELYSMLPDIPDDRLLLETDAPYLTPRDLKPKPKGGRNSPHLLPHIASHVAKARGQTLEAISALTQANVKRLFGLKMLQS